MAGRKITVEFLGKNSTNKTVSDVEKRFGKMGSTLDRVGQRAGKVLAGGLAAAGVAAVKLGQKASDLAETQSKVAQIFGKDSTAALDKFASSAATTMGQSKQTALDGAATFGIIGKSAGLAGDDLVGFSTKMVGLAGDMASFNNVSPEEAIAAIGAGMRGEAEPLRKFGVLLDDATLRSQALKMGLIKTTKEALTPQQKSLAAQAVIMKQTTVQQGDFARTSEGLANKQRILKAQLENMGTALGEKVLPFMLKATDAGAKMAAWVDKNQALTGTLVAVLGTLAAGLWLASVAMRALAVATSMSPLGIAIIAIAALVAGLVVAYQKVAWFRAAVQVAARAVGAVFTWLWNSAVRPALLFIGKALGALMLVWGKMLQALGKVPGFGWAKAAGDKMTAAGHAAWNLGDSIKKIPNSHNTKVTIGDESAIAKLNRLATKIRNLPNGQVSISVAGKGTKIAGFAHGTNSAPGGMALVGEEGPELVNLPRGSKVFTNRQSLRMASSPTATSAATQTADTRPLIVQLVVDGKVLHQSLVKRKRETGMALGLA